MSLSWIVARRRGCQLATTAPILTPPGKPSTWFPGEGLVTQAQMFICSQICLFKNQFVSSTPCICHFMSFLKFLNLTQICSFLKCSLIINLLSTFIIYLNICTKFALKYFVLTSFDVIKPCKFHFTSFLKSSKFDPKFAHFLKFRRE